MIFSCSDIKSSIITRASEKHARNLPADHFMIESRMFSLFDEFFDVNLEISIRRYRRWSCPTRIIVPRHEKSTANVKIAQYFVIFTAVQFTGSGFFVYERVRATKTSSVLVVSKGNTTVRRPVNRFTIHRVIIILLSSIVNDRTRWRQ